MAEIQFSRGVAETVVPEVRLTKSKTSNTGVATFTFIDPQIFDKENTNAITGMYLVDTEGEMSTNDVKGKFYDGKARAIEARVVLNSEGEWDRFMRFMERYGEENGLGFTKA